MGRAVQLKFFDDKRLTHGGSLGEGKRKTRRPFSSKKPLHLVLRLEDDRRLSLLSHGKLVRSLLSIVSQRWGIRIYRYSINSNHLHLLLRARHKRDFQSFLRHFTGTLCMRLTRTGKGRPLVTRFFKLPFTRIGEWGKAYEAIKSYVFQNEMEAAGQIPYRARNVRDKAKPIERPTAYSRQVQPPPL